MKKILLCVLVSCLTVLSFAQEVRGVETRLATYQGKEYELGYPSRYHDWIVFGHSSEYLGFEFTNLNSIPVSVSVEIYSKRDDRLIETKEIVLKSKESYICKYPTLKKYHCDGVTSYEYSKSENLEEAAEEGKRRANQYYVKYKAYKLL